MPTSVMTPGDKEGVADYSTQRVNEPNGCPKVVEEEPEVVENVIGGVCGPHCSVENSSSKIISRKKGKKRALFQSKNGQK